MNIENMVNKASGNIFGTVKKVVTLGVGIVLAYNLTFGMYHSTGTTEVGVRTTKIGIIDKKGVHPNEYAPGSAHFFSSALNDWHKFDTKLVNLNMRLGKGENPETSDNYLRFKTSDGNDIGLDITFAYRIDPKKAPFILEYVAQSDEELREKVVETVCRSRPRDLFGELDTESFYTATKRNAASERAKIALNEVLNPLGVIVEKVDSGNYHFLNDEYAQAIKDKKLFDGEFPEVVAKQKSQVQINANLFNEAQLIVNQTKEKADGLYRQEVLAADGRYQKQSQLAEAVVVEGNNQAESIKAARKAMMSAGGRTLVQMQIAESLAGKPIYMIPSSGDGSGNLAVTTFNLNDYLKMVGITEAMKK